MNLPHLSARLEHGLKELTVPTRRGMLEGVGALAAALGFGVFSERVAAGKRKKRKRKKQTGSYHFASGTLSLHDDCLNGNTTICTNVQPCG